MKSLNVDLGKDSYEILIEKGILDKVPAFIKGLEKWNNIAIITDSNVDSLYGERFLNSLETHGFKVVKSVFPAGESSKNFETYIKIQGELIEKGIKRGDLIITFGGGVVGDLGGFVAATLFRGVDFIQIPTTLLSQVDSSVGGKVAIDMPQGKNLVGAFYQPKAVYIDPLLLDTLSSREVNSGFSEVIKYGAIYSESFFDFLAGLDNPLNEIETIIEKCCEIKSLVVAEDERDTGMRMILNFGHTLGHGIEQHYGFSKYTHGEAVAIGMVLASKIGYALGFTSLESVEKIEGILKGYSLPISDPVKLTDLIKFLKNDKKNFSGVIQFILIEKIGKIKIEKIKEESLSEILSNMEVNL